MQYSETKDSSISYVNTRCVRAACDRLGIPYTIHDEYGNFLSVDLGRPFLFANAATPFNSSAVDKVCKDKEFTWKLLADVVQMPKTKGYFDPYPMDEQYAGYIRETDYEAIADDISNQFSFPMIVKMNAGGMYFFAKTRHKCLLPSVLFLTMNQLGMTMSLLRRNIFLQGRNIE
jgi:hypothetical protein